MKKSLIIIAILVCFGAAVFIIKHESNMAQETITPAPAATNPPPVSFDEIKAVLGAEATGPVGVKITPLEVTQDSRCPEGVDCFQAGTVVVKANVSYGTQDATGYEFELNKKLQTSYGDITLTAVDPKRVENHNIEPAEYVFTFDVQR